jgi:hypothetical protein
MSRTHYDDYTTDICIFELDDILQSNSSEMGTGAVLQ